MSTFQKRRTGPAAIDVRALRRFVDDAPLLRNALESPAGSPRELMLRSAMRDAIGELAAVLHEAAADESSRTRAEVIRVASLVADALAGRRRGSARSSAGH